MFTKQSVVVVILAALCTLSIASPARADDTCGCEAAYAACVQSSTPPPPYCQSNWQACDSAWESNCWQTANDCYDYCNTYAPYGGCYMQCDSNRNVCLTQCD